MVLPTFAAEITDLDARLGKAAPAHPRLFFPEAETAALKARIEADPLLKGVFDRLKASAEAAQKLEAVKREKVGKRLLGVSRTCLQRVAYSAFAYRMTRTDAFLQDAQREMLAAASFDDWNPSHFLDVAEMTAALALGYDWLFNDLTPEVRQTIRTAIVEKGLKASIPGGRDGIREHCHAQTRRANFHTEGIIARRRETLRARYINAAAQLRCREPRYPHGGIRDRVSGVLSSDTGRVSRTG